MKKKIIVIGIVLIIAIVAVVIITGNINGKKEIETTPVPTITPEVTEETAVTEPNASAEVEETGEVPEISSTNGNAFGWDVEGDAIPEVTQQPSNQVSQDLATGENETERIPLSLLGDDD